MIVKNYLVGGAVRDFLLGLTPEDRDFVVVGSTPEEMLAQGFQQVGANFPVFLHPKTGDEYALARTERKVGAGYTGFTTTFDPTVTLEDDLRRRDLTINSMAMPVRETPGHGLIVDKKHVIDPFSGQQDLKQRKLRHTSEAFAEDPLRVLRLARFAARYNFEVAPDTMVLAKHLVRCGELEALTHERVWKEVNRALMESQPARFFEVLFDADVMDTHFFKNVFKGLTLERVRLIVMALKICKAPLEVRLGVLSSLDLNGREAFKQDSLSHWMASQRTFLKVELEKGLTPEVLLGVVERSRLLQASEKVDVFFQLVNVLECIGELPADSLMALSNVLERVKEVDSAKAAEGFSGKAAGQAIHQARLAAVMKRPYR